MRTLGMICTAVAACGMVLSHAAPPRDEVPDLGTRKGGDDWPTFLGPQGDAKSAETGLLDRWPENGPPIVWRVAIGEGYSMPSISRGRLFQFDRHGDKARLTCRNSETGEELWRQEYPTPYEDLYQFSNGPRTSPVVDDDRVYTFGVEGVLRCHRVTDGKLLWAHDTTARFHVVQNFFGVGSTPVIEDDLLIVPIGGSPPGSDGIQSGETRGAGSGIVAFDKHSGEVRYQVSNELASYSSPLLTTIGDRRWGLYFARGGLLGFEPATGKIDFVYPWRAKKLESVNASNPVVVGDTVFITECYGPGSSLVRVRPGGYDVVWKDPDGRDKSMLSHWATPIHHEGTLYGSSGRNSGDAELRAIDHGSGKLRWSEPGLGRVTLLYAEGHLIALGERGRLTLIRATPEKYSEVSKVVLQADGEPLIEYPAWNAPILSHGLLYVRGKDQLACLDLRAR